MVMAIAVCRTENGRVTGSTKTFFTKEEREEERERDDFWVYFVHLQYVVWFAG